MTEVLEPTGQNRAETPRKSLSTIAARNLSTTTKTPPQMREITSRWLLRVLPWTQVNGGVYRVNRRMTYTVGDNRITFANTGAQVRVLPMELSELPALRGFDDPEVLAAMAERFQQREYTPGQTIAEFGHQTDQVFLLAHGKVNRIGAGKYGDETVLGVMADGDYFGAQSLVDGQAIWEFTARAATPCIVLSMPQQSFQELVERSDSLREHIDAVRSQDDPEQNEHGEAAIAMSAGHDGEPELPGTFVDYETSPREYELSVAQTVLRVHSRVADLYNQPMDQVEQQLRLTIEALREKQEDELVNNRDFGLLANTDLQQRLQTRLGPPTPDDMDELLSAVWKNPSVFLAHPKAIAAFGRECNRRGLYPQSIDLYGHQVPAWRGIPMLPCNKIPVSDGNTSSIMLMRTGEAEQGVIGLHQVDLPDEYQPGLSVRFMGINEQAIISYLVSAYYSAAVLVPDALAVLENVELARSDDA